MKSRRRPTQVDKPFLKCFIESIVEHFQVKHFSFGFCQQFK